MCGSSQKIGAVITKQTGLPLDDDDACPDSLGEGTGAAGAAFPAFPFAAAGGGTAGSGTTLTGLAELESDTIDGFTNT